LEKVASLAASWFKNHLSKEVQFQQTRREVVEV